MMNSEVDTEFDFEAFSEAAKDDEDRFEDMRQQLIEELIASAPERSRDRLRCLQWRIDQERRMAKTPLAACMNISKIMWGNVIGEGGLREHLGELSDLLQGQVEDRPARESCQILAFAVPETS